MQINQEVIKMVIGFVGFGEANSSIAQGLREEGLSEIICFDAMQADPRFRDKIAQKADSCGAKQMESSAMVCQSVKTQLPCLW